MANPESIPAEPSRSLSSVPGEFVLRAVLSTATEPIIVFDRRGRTLTGSTAAAQAAGLSLRELPGASVGDLALPDALRSSLASGLAAILETGAPPSATGPAEPGERTPSPGYHVAPVRGPGGEILGAVCRLESAAVRGCDEERFRALVEITDDVVFTLDRELRHTGLYGRQLKAEGIVPAQILGHTVRDLLGPVPAATYEEAARRALDGEQVDYEWETEGPHGRRFHQISVAPMRGEDGSVTGVIGVRRDVTDRRREQEELSRLLEWSCAVKEEWRATLDALPEFVALVDFVGCVVRGNHTLETWGHRGPGEISGLEFHELLHPGCTAAACYLREAQRRAWDATVEGRDVSVEADDTYLHRYVRVSFRPVVHTDPHRAMPTMLAVVEDLSAAQRARLDHERMEVQLRSAQKLEALAQLAGGMAHEINVPAQRIGDNLRFLREGVADATATLRKMQEALESAAEGRLDAAVARGLLEELRASDLEAVLREMPAAATHSIEGIERVGALVRAMKEFAESGAGPRPRGA